MKKKQQIILFFTLSILMYQIFSPIPTLKNTNIEQQDLISWNTNKEEREYKPSNTIHSVPLEQELPLKTNVVPQGDFEENTSYNTPEGFSAGGTGLGVYNLSYQDSVHTGNYAGMVKSQGTLHTSSVYSIYRYYGLSGMDINEGIDLDLFLNISNPTIAAGGVSYIYLRLQNSSDDFSVHYYISYNPSNEPNWNYTTTKYIKANTSNLNTWINFNRELDTDFDSLFGPSSSPVALTYLYLYVISPINASLPTQLIIDDISTVNSTGYDYTSNGDFETGTGSGWSSSSFQSPSKVEITNKDFTQGSSAVNLSCESIKENSYGYAYINKYFSSPQGGFYPEYSKIQFNYKITDSGDNTSDYRVLFRARLRKGTDYYYVYRYLLIGNNNTAGYTNDTWNRYTYSSNFGAREKWIHESIDLSKVNLDSTAIHSIEFSASLGRSDGSYFSVVIDDFRLVTYPTGDPSFEQDYEPSPVLTSWYYSGSAPSLINDTRTGLYALNISVDGSSSRVFRSSELQVTSDLFTSFWWRLDNHNLAMDNVAYFTLDFGTEILCYIVAASPSYIVTNSSSIKYIYTTNYNQNSTWLGLYRNITADLNNSFGYVKEWKLEQIDFFCYADGGSPITVIIDDFGFIRTAPPVVSTVIRSVPNHYYQTTIITFNTYSTYCSVLNTAVYYRADGVWYIVQANRVGAITFTATIPALPYGNVDFYINATDILGHIRIEDNQGSYYSYQVTDNIDPELTISSPVNSSTISGLFQVIVNTTDVGSDIDRVEYFVDEMSVGNTTADPFVFTLNSRDFANGSRTVKVVSYDNAGNSIEKSILLDFQNDLDAPSYSDVWIFPEFPQYFESCTVTVAITDASGVENVSLYYKIGTADWTSILMNPSGALYSATIPQAPYGIQVSLYIEAFDVYGTKLSLGDSDAPYNSYTVRDSIDPNLQVTGPLPNSNLTGTVDFHLSGYDAGSGIDVLEVKVDDTTISSLSSLPSSLTWDTSSVANGEHTLTFILRDKAGNEKEVSIIYQINNPSGFDAFSFQISQFIQANGVIVGASSVILLYGAVRLFLWRKSRKG